MSKIISEHVAKRLMEGGGVPVNRVFGYHETDKFDPFLMLDYFETEEGIESPGFPWHPHKGMETITYMLQGHVEHEDSMGNKGIIGPGELQWMSAGKGIMHQEMPVTSPQGIKGLQFWLNLPSVDKLKDPHYDYIKNGEMPVIDDHGIQVRVIAGTYKQVKGPINKSTQGITMLHVTMEKNTQFSIMRDQDKQGFVFIMSGQVEIEEDQLRRFSAYTLRPGVIQISASEKVDFIFAQGKPLKESIAWQGPIVMNTREELIETFNDINNNRFGK